MTSSSRTKWPNRSQCSLALDDFGAGYSSIAVAAAAFQRAQKLISTNSPSHTCDLRVIAPPRTHGALAIGLSMISSENRMPLFGIML
jgi:hypothetical protein